MTKKCRFKIVNPKDFSYSNYRKNYNLSIEQFPCKIAICCNEEDVIKTLKIAKEKNLDFRIRNHRHDFEGNSNLDCGLVIDLSNINHIFIDEENLTATIGGGTNFRDVYNFLSDRGFTIPGGTCADVGVVGLSTAAGIGYSTRYLGFSMDNIIELTLIDANFQKLTVNSTTNWDLFWAIKGAQPSSFGVITEIKFKIYKVSDITYFKSSWPINYDVSLIDAFQKFAYNTDERLTMNLVFEKNECNKLNLNISGQFFGPKDEVTELLTPLFEITSPLYFTLKTAPYKDIIKLWDEECLPPNMFKNSGSFFYVDLSETEIKKILNLVEIAPCGFLHSIEMLSLGGKVLSYPNNTASFPHRQAHYLLQIKCVWRKCDDEILNKHWTANFKDYIDTVGVGNYRGFTDFNISNWQYQYFGYNYPILREIKTKYDPSNFFKFYQGIQPLEYNTSKLTGEIILPSDTNYNETRTLYNLYFDYYPVAIVYAKNIDDVSNAVIWAKENYVNLRIRGGGHNYEGFCSANYSLLLDMSNLKTLKVNDYTNTVTIGSGFLLGDLYDKLYKLGYQFTGGTCKEVGVAGLVSGGGVGLSSRLYGLCCDNLTSVKLINEKGKLVIATNSYNSDLFFAIKGSGGGNFGVIVELTFKIRPVKNITFIKITWPDFMNFDVIRNYDNFMYYADKRVTLELTVSKSGSILEGFSYASLEETKIIINQILCIPNKASEIIEYIPFIDAVNIVGEKQPPNNYFKNSSSYIYEPLSDEAINTILYNLNNESASGFYHGILIIPFGGKIVENSPQNTSYAHRFAHYLIQYISRWNESDNENTNIEWIENFRQSMLPYTKGAYINFSDMDIVNYSPAYYKNLNNTMCLLDIKNAYLRNNWLFNFPQSIK